MRGNGYWDDPYIIESINDLDQYTLDHLVKPLGSDKIYIVQSIAIDGTEYYNQNGSLFTFNISNTDIVYDGYYMKNKNIVCGAVYGELRNFFVYRDIFIDIIATSNKRYPNYGIVGLLVGKLNNCHSIIMFDNIEYTGYNTISGLVGYTYFRPKQHAIILGCTSNIFIRAKENTEYKGTLQIDGIVGNNTGASSYGGDVRVINTAVKADIVIDALPNDQRGADRNVFQGIGNVYDITGCCVDVKFIGDEYFAIARNFRSVKGFYSISSVRIVRHEYYIAGMPVQRCRCYGIGNATNAGEDDVQGGIRDCYVKLNYESPYDVFIDIEDYKRSSVNDDYYYIIVDASGNKVADCRKSPNILGIKSIGNGEVLQYNAVLLVGGVAQSNERIKHYDYVSHPFGNLGDDSLDQCYYSIDDNNRKYINITSDKEVTNEELKSTLLQSYGTIKLVVNSTDENGYGYGFINKAVRDEFDYLNRFGKLAIRTGVNYDDYAYISCYQQDLFLNNGYPSLTRVKYRYLYGIDNIEIKEYPLNINIGGDFIVGMHLGEEKGQILGEDVNYGLKVTDFDGNIKTLW